ncbi:glutamate synthase [Bosea sp. AAP35]|uniref:NAD(P)-binding protein n=1 Tax=Bosea sp. AAP35 TaxID=1523417 RepID=UPI0006B985A3|nr:NAD(P)-binding protein [Bosea sp. AAP35]KPF71352.1 glutamate synthase [Bosea sp. AAP35]
MTVFARDMTPRVDLTLPHGTGPVRSQRPIYVDLLPPCNAACPAGEDIQGWLGLAQAGKFKAAWEALIADNPMPAIHGRVCYHPCETSCNRKDLDSEVSIHAVERFLGDQASLQGWSIPKAAASSGKRILVVGAGPSGLSAAYHLTRLGHQVEIREAGPLPGGMLHFGIPAYRLPRADLMREIARIEAFGVKIVLNHKVEDLLAEQASGGFDAAFIAIGAQKAHHVEIPARDAARVYSAVGLLHQVEAGTAPQLGRRVVVYGAGNSAMDAARTAKRLGAEEALVVFIMDKSRMEARAFEAQEAVDEGVTFKWLSAIKDIGADTMVVERMRMDEAGHPQPTGEFETLKADSVVLALGQEAESGFLGNIPEITYLPGGIVVVDASMMTGRPGIFAGGDMVPSQRSVTIATGHGKKAARHIDAWLRDVKPAQVEKHPGITYAGLNLPIYADAAPSRQSELSPSARKTGFDEVLAGLSEAEALHEAKRCLSCGNCFECDNCFAACPEDAIIKLGPTKGYEINLETCTGCSVCVEQCPCHAMEMVPEQMMVQA